MTTIWDGLALDRQRQESPPLRCIDDGIDRLRGSHLNKGILPVLLGAIALALMLPQNGADDSAVGREELGDVRRGGVGI